MARPIFASASDSQSGGVVAGNAGRMSGPECVCVAVTSTYEMPLDFDAFSRRRFTQASAGGSPRSRPTIAMRVSPASSTSTRAMSGSRTPVAPAFRPP